MDAMLNHQIQPGSTTALSSSYSSLRELRRDTISLLSHLSGFSWDKYRLQGHVSGSRINSPYDPKNADFSIFSYQELSDVEQGHRLSSLPAAASVIPGSRLTDITARLAADRCVGECTPPLLRHSALITLLSGSQRRGKLGW